MLYVDLQLQTCLYFFEHLSTCFNVQASGMHDANKIYNIHSLYWINTGINGPYNVQLCFTVIKNSGLYSLRLLVYMYAMHIKTAYFYRDSNQNATAEQLFSQYCCKNCIYYAPAPNRRGIKRWCRLTSDCLSRTSGLSREQRGIGRPKLAQGNPRHIGHHFQGQKVKGQGQQAALLTAGLARQAAAVVGVWTCWPWETAAMLPSARRRKALRRPRRRGAGAYRGGRPPTVCYYCCAPCKVPVASTCQLLTCFSNWIIFVYFKIIDEHSHSLYSIAYTTAVVKEKGREVRRSVPRTVNQWALPAQQGASYLVSLLPVTTLTTARQPKTPNQ